jgi:hypothetical protein|tara:strand:- start:10303 stop:10557 length:255 start_codon:yes stop_codon:yes gene_type:complete
VNTPPVLVASSNIGGGWKKALNEAITGKSIVLHVGGLIIGAVCGSAKLVDVEPFFFTAFKGALCIFLLELGLIAGKPLSDAGKN